MRDILLEKKGGERVVKKRKKKRDIKYDKKTHLPIFLTVKMVRELRLLNEGHFR